MNKSTLLKSAPKEQSLLLIRFPLFSHIKQHQRLLLLMVSLAVFILTVSLPTSLIGQSQTFTSTSTFTVPSGIYSITVECWGGGGAGGGTSNNSAKGGGGGAGGAYAKKVISVTPGTTHTVTVGTTKAGGTAAGGQGNPSWFGTTSTVFAEGGAGGALPNGGTANGGIGSSANSIGDLVYAGGSAANGSATIGGAGGGGAGSTGIGGNASGTTAGTGTTAGGGNGGAGRTSTGGNGNDGTVAGGGGGGAFVNNTTNRDGGDGAAGKVIVSWTCSPISSFPLSESFDATTFPPSCWAQTNYSRQTSGTNPTCTPHSGAGMVRFNSYTLTAGTTGTLITPELNLPDNGYRVKFWIYRDNAYLTDADLVNVLFNTSASVTGATTLGTVNRSISLAPVVATAGWYEYSFNLGTNSAGSGKYVILQSVSGYGNNIFLDDVVVETSPPFADFSASSTSAAAGQTITFTDASGGTTITSWNWNFGTGATPATANTQGPHNVTYSTSGLKTISLTVNGSISTTKTDYVSIYENPYKAPRQLNAEVSGFSDVNLNWISPATNETFEPYDNFDLSFGGYTFIDGDGGATYAIQDVTFTNAGYTGSFIAFNPTLTTPVLPSTWAAHSGQKYAACFATVTASAPNNDWIITPKVKIASGEQLKFWAKSITNTYGLERFKVGISTTGTSATDFTIVSTGTYLEAPITWTEYTFDLASYVGQEIYIGINCVSNDAFCFMLDDLSITGGPVDGSIPFSFNFEETGLVQPVKVMPTGSTIVATGDNDAPSSFTTYKIFRNGSEIANVSGFTYTDSDLVPGTYDYTIKAVYVDPADESAEEGPAQVVTTITRWTGASNTDWQNASNWRTGSIPGSSANIGIPGTGVSNFPTVTASGTECNHLTLKNGAVLTINADASLSVNGTLSNETGASGLIIQSDATGTGSLIHNTASIPATVERFIPNDWKWHFLSSPVASQPIWPNFAPDPGAGLNFGSTWNWDFYYWNPNANTSNSLYWVNLRKENGDYNDGAMDQTGSFAGFGSATPELVTGRGYLVAYNTGWNPATSSPTTHTFTGNLNTGNINKAVLVGENSFNLAGNPYASSIDWKSSNWGNGRNVLVNNAGGFDYWIWNDTDGNYGVFNSAGADNSGTLGVSRFIAPQQAFFVQAASDGNLALNNDLRTHSSQTWLKNEETENSVLRLELSTPSNSYHDEMVVEFNPSFTGGGSSKFWSFYTEAPEIYTVKDGTYYSIDRYTDLSRNTIVQLGTKTESGVDYVINASNISDFDLTNKVYLEDLSTGSLIDLRMNPSYSFKGGAGQNTERFRLIFEASTGINSLEASNFNVYSSGKTVYILNNGVKNEFSTEIINISGQVVSFKESQQDELTKIELNSAPGVYIVRIISSGKVTSVKIVIQ